VYGSTEAEEAKEDPGAIVGMVGGTEEQEHAP